MDNDALPNDVIGQSNSSSSSSVIDLSRDDSPLRQSSCVRVADTEPEPVDLDGEPPRKRRRMWND